MDRLLIDTCVWFDIAVETRLTPLLDVLDRLCGRHAIQLVVPDLLIAELDRNVERVEERTKKMYESLAREVLDMAQILANEADKTDLRRSVGKITTALPNYQGTLNAKARRIKTMLTAANARSQTTTDLMMATAFKRGLLKKAPFVKGKNSCGDALMLEHFELCSQQLEAADRCVFITTNKEGFCLPDDHRLPHPEIAGLFDQAKRLFSINLAEHLKGLDTEAVSPAIVEAVREVSERPPMLCPKGGEHEFDPENGANLRSRYGGLTWHMFCRKCGAKFDTGEFFD